MLSQAIAQANKEVEDAIRSKKGKHGHYNQYTAKELAEIGKYACLHDASAARVFSRKLGVRLNESTTRVRT